MTALLRVSVMCVTLSALTLFTGCSKKSDNWLIGEWEFDAETAKANMTTSNPINMPENMTGLSVPDEVKKKVVGQLSNQLTDYMANIKLTITSNKITSILPDETISYSYKIIKRPDANTIVVKSREGEINTFVRSGNNISMTTDGPIKVKMYLKPAN